MKNSSQIKVLSLSISLPLVRRLGRVKKKRGTGGGDDGAALSELRTNRGSGHRHVHASHLALQTRRSGWTRVQASRQDGMGGARTVALGHPVDGLASGVGALTIVVPRNRELTPSLEILLSAAERSHQRFRNTRPSVQTNLGDDAARLERLRVAALPDNNP
jgi:hypothetical protein